MRRRAHILPTICQRLQTSPVISSDELALLDEVFALPRWAVEGVQS
jgi:hypothetical protein